MTERLDIDILRTLKAIHDHGGITRAAEKLSLSQSAVSHKIRRFEQNIGCQLLRRKPGKTLFTGDGKHLLGYAEKIISMHDEALSGIHRSTLEGRIRLGITEELVNAGLSEVLGRFGRLYPRVRVRSCVEQSTVLREQLRQGSLDMIVMQLFESEVGEHDRVLQRDRLLWVKSADFELPEGNRIPFIAFDQNCFYRQWAMQTFAGSDTELDVILECASNEGVCSAVEAGMGVALIARRHLRDNMERVNLPDPPELAFVIRCGEADPAPHLTALGRDIGETLADRSTDNATRVV